MKNKNLTKKGIFFTIDALIAAMILISGIILMTSSHITEQPRTVINHLSHDLLNLLAELQVWEVNNSFIWSLYENGSITNLNNTIIQQTGEFWAKENLVLANQFIANISEGIFEDNYGYSISFDKETIFTRTTPLTNSLVTSKKLVSGIQKSKPIKGFISKARATSIWKQSTKIISFSPEGAGWDGSTGDRGMIHITKYFDLGTISISNVTFFISMHSEDDSGSDYQVININDMCSFNRDELNWESGEEGLFDIQDVTSCLLNGTNFVNITIWNNGYNAHLHPGMYLLINYTTSENITYLANENSERVYFDNLVSDEGDGDGSGVWAIMPFHIPEEANNINVKLQLNLQEVNDLKDRTGWWWVTYNDAWDFEIFVNSDTHFLRHGGTYTDINDCLHYSAACGNDYDYLGSWNITSEVEDGTNVVSVYVNNYGDIVGGDDLTILYSDPINNPDNSSYIEINYTITPTLPYGVVEIRRTHEFEGVVNSTKDTNFSFPSEAKAISDVYTHIAEQYSYISTVDAGTGFPPGTEIFESPSARAVPTDIQIPKSTIDVSELITNYVRVQEQSGNDVRPESTIDYGFYVPSFVGYGNVFNTIDEANANAITRLQTVMGSFVNVSDLVLDNTSMSDVPSMWGPAIIEVRVWN